MSTVDEERLARRGLACVCEAGDLRLTTVLKQFNVVELWEGLQRSSGDSSWVARARTIDLAQIVAAEEAAEARFVIPGDDEWPAHLNDLAHGEAVQDMGGVPLGLWVRGQGQLATLAHQSVALVGARASTHYGDRVAADLGASVAAQGWTVVSGAAYGIDAAAHRGALAEQGPTVAVLASGVDEPYPRAHASLLKSISQTGAVVSEQAPGMHPTRRRFLARNRLIAALTQATVIIEAAARSGARNTVTWANTLGRPVGAVPGMVTSATSYTPHRLIREHEAVLVSSAEEIVELIRPLADGPASRKPGQIRLLDGLTTAQQAVYEVVPSRGGRKVGELALKAGLPVSEVWAVLDELAESGLVEQRDDGRWRLGRVRNQPVLPTWGGRTLPTTSTP